MLASLANLGPDGTNVRNGHGACLGACLHLVLPEDEFDRQPYIGAGGRFLLVADARVDNRGELAAALAISAAEMAETSDCELLLRGWERWGARIADHLLGDIAMAVWDNEAGELALVRTPLSNRPLFYHLGDGFAAFSSLPSALFTIPSIRREPNVAAMAELLAGDIYRPGEVSMFRGIESVPQGKAIFIRNGAKRSVRLWSLERVEPRIEVAEAGEAIRAELDRAVAAQLRRRQGSVACHLSAGRDSSAVATSAALQEKGQQVIALTSAPRAGFPAISDSYWLGDESVIAAETAERAGLQHIICRSQQAELTGLFESIMTKHFQPVANPVNLPWIANLNEEAARNGASVLLTGELGNFGLSLGGPGFLGEYWRKRGARAWWWQANALRGQLNTPWLNLLSISFGSLIPRTIFSTMRSLSGRGKAELLSLPLLRMPIRRQAEEIRYARLGDARPPASRRRYFADLLMSIEHGEKYSMPTWGMDRRDPTADRRFVELCHSLPVEAFVGPEGVRPAYAAAFGGRLPSEVIQGRQAGYQAASWYETIRPDEVRSAFRNYARHPLVAELFDLPEIERRLDSWPRSKGDRIEIYEVYCNQLLGALALACFINVQLPA